MPPPLLPGGVAEEHRPAQHPRDLDGQAVRDRRRVQRRQRRHRGARRLRLLRGVPRRAFPAQRAWPDHLRGHARDPHRPAGRVRPRLPRGPPGQAIAASIPAGLSAERAPARRRLRLLDFAVLSLYWIAIGYLWNSLTALILPDLIIQLVGRANEGTAAGFLKALGTIVAVVWQPIVGGISDRTSTRWGRR